MCVPSDSNCSCNFAVDPTTITEDLRPCVRELREYLREKRDALDDGTALPAPIEEDEIDGIYCVTQEGIEAGRWITCKEAWLRLGIVKSTLTERLNACVLKRFHRKGDEHLPRPRVWLSKEQVEAYYRDYTLLKGKEK